ncbi:DNA uptake porin HofQ [Pantoea rwandensis]|uniref:DNA uptake porin HofQ n=1 Tax=Pantoea rwandensis TaxID=1076550 RepID=UPI000A120E15|nr:DNA uptake porin HofQ [Pantoea rwandensis]
MKRMVLIFCLIFSVPLRASNDRLSLVFDDAPVERILQALADYQQTNLLIAPGVEGRLSLRLDEIDGERALALVARLAKLTLIQEEGVLLVYPESWQQMQALQSKAENEEREQQVPLEQYRVTLHYATASDVYRSLQTERSLLTARGSVTVDSRTNSLLLRDTAKALRDTTRWLTALDRPLEQVELSAHIITIHEEHLRELGVNWSTSPAQNVTAALRNPQLAIPLTVENPALRAGVTLGKLSGELLNLELSALEQENQIEIIASPRLFTSNQQTASIKQGTEIPYEVKSGSSGATAIEFKEAVLGMEVTPVVLGNGRIQLKLRLSQNMPGRSLSVGENKVLSIDKQEIETQVTLRDGETLALGGIFQQQRTQGEKRVPWLGEVPLLGNLFRHQTEEQKKKELVIFITPRLVREAALTGG